MNIKTSRGNSYRGSTKKVYNAFINKKNTLKLINANEEK